MADKHDRQFPERYSPDDIDGRKLAALFVQLQIALGKDLGSDRNLVPGLRTAMNILIDIDSID